MKWLTIGLLKGYQLYLSPDKGWLGKLMPRQGQTCRFEPTCSDYAIQAVERFGVIKGLRLGGMRVARCNPWGGHGYDPIPEK